MKITPETLDACMTEIVGPRWREAFIPDETGMGEFRYALYCIDARQCEVSGEWWEDADLSFCHERQCWVAPDWTL